MRHAPPPTSYRPTAAERAAWPKLSETLPAEREPGVCQSCGLSSLGVDGQHLRCWQEADSDDRPTAIVILLCTPCSDRLIKPHPRLYRELRLPLPLPGVLQLCRGCSFRVGLTCAHPDRVQNGGAGLALEDVQGSNVHINYGGGRGEWLVLYAREPHTCTGRKAGPNDPEPRWCL